MTEDSSKEFIALLKRFQVGDGLTDKELDWLLVFFHTIENDLNLLDAVDRQYHLVWIEVKRQKDRLEGYKKARQEQTPSSLI